MEKDPKTYEELGDIERLKKELSDARKQLRERAAVDSGQRAVVEALRELIPTRPEVPAPHAHRPRKDSRGVYEGLAHLTDWHHGEVVRASSTGGLAQYDPQISRERMEAATEEIIDIGRYMKIGRLAVLWGGDMMSGMIHDDLERSNAEMVVAQTLEMGDITTEALERFSQSFRHVDVIGVSGNHGRPYRPMFFNRKQTENYDYFLYKIQEYRLAELAKKDRMRFLTNESFWNIIEVGNRNFLAMHGDTIKHQNSMSLPWYSMFKELMKWMGMREQGGVPWFDDMNIGHFHNPATITMGNSTLRVAPAGKGRDDYSFAGSRMPVPAGARFLAVSEGEVKSDHIINLDNVGRPDTIAA